MSPSMEKKKIQALTGKLEALNKFISRYLDRLLPFFKALKGTSSGGWGLECDKAFRAINEFLASSLTLSQSIEGEELYL